MIEFCPNCGTRLVMKRKKDLKEAFLICQKCGYEKQMETPIFSPSRRVSEIKPEDNIVVIGEKEQKLKTLPVITVECPKCGNNLAYVWQVQTRGADESSTQFFRCTRCSYTFREYS
ncbi:MAG: transcription factor S [Candidatus Bathyarchaeota archaeon]|nr:transcription factor S [Candidatus Bathyarchaeota archaeon]